MSEESLTPFDGHSQLEEETVMTNEKIATNVGPAKIDIAYERIGDADAPPVLLIQGLAAQMIGWPDGFCDELVARGLQLIRFDNRDAGHSSRITNAPAPDLPAVLRGDLSSVSYTLSDMAADSVGLLAALGIDSAHFVGVSMGGAISQTAAIEHPGRVRSLTSMMSTTGDMAVGQARPETLHALFSGGPARSREEFIAQQVRAVGVIGSPGFPADLDAVAARAALSYDRGFDATAVARQGIASVASGDRTALLRQLDVPTLIIHGLDDAMCDVSGGRATAAAIPNARLILYEGMGHGLPAELWPKIADRIAENVRLGEARAHR